LLLILWFIVSEDPKNSRLIKTARVVNDEKPDWVINKIKAEADLQKTRKIVCLGLAFKPDIDDLRESPAVKVVESLIEQGYDVSCVEPNIIDHAKYNLIDIKKAIAEFDIIALLVNHKEFTTKTTLTMLDNKGALDFCGAFLK